VETLFSFRASTHTGLSSEVARNEKSYGKGRVLLLGFRAQFRAQSHATFKLLFNALHWSAATREGSK